MVSILFAFGIDAWWQRQGDAQEQRRYLQALVVDFEVNAERLDSLQEIHQEGADAALKLLAMSGPDAQVDDPIEIGALLRGVARHPTFAPATGTVTALVQAGYLTRLGSDALEAELASWDEELRDYSEDEAWGAEDVRVRLVPFLSTYVPLSMGFAANDRFPADYSAVLRSIEFGNQMTVRAHRTGVILEQLGPFREKALRIAKLARQELSR